ncbi:MAG: hypothetical protein NTW86_10730 [Candidatus Sumerlaeota bacterium]|nr:hypothetical protein [Candidatus Sumerlaeota bacterium]
MPRPDKQDFPGTRHRFFLNPYDEYAFTKCPKCDAKTAVRKIPLVIHIEPRQLFMLNKSCKRCPACDLIIARKSEIESLMAAAFEKRDPGLIGNEYLVVGTMDRKDWLQAQSGKISQEEALNRLFVFEDVWKFEVIPGGWYPEGKHPLERLNQGAPAPERSNPESR